MVCSGQRIETVGDRSDAIKTRNHPQRPKTTHNDLGSLWVVFGRCGWFRVLVITRERDKTIGSNEKTKALHVRFKFWYISSPNSAKQQREMAKFGVLWRT